MARVNIKYNHADSKTTYLISLGSVTSLSLKKFDFVICIKATYMNHDINFNFNFLNFTMVHVLDFMCASETLLIESWNVVYMYNVTKFNRVSCPQNRY